MNSEFHKKLYLALVHHPVRNKAGNVSTTAITNLDIHDIARSCKTFGIQNYFLVTPLESQMVLANRVLDYWSTVTGSRLVPSRKQALELVRVKESIEKAIEFIVQKTGQNPLLVATSAQHSEKTTGYGEMRDILQSSSRPCLLLFGTGYGLIAEVIQKADYLLDPIYGIDDYNHLSVRAAVAIILDRLISRE
jgi:hypothetical protein